jgi:hypothetical protein
LTFSVYNLHKANTSAMSSYENSGVLRSAKILLKDNMTMRHIMTQAMKHLNCRRACQYALYKADQPNVDLDLDTPLKDIPRPYVFQMYRKFGNSFFKSRLILHSFVVACMSALISIEFAHVLLRSSKKS